MTDETPSAAIDESRKRGWGKRVAAIEVSRSWIARDRGWEWMCCFCGETPGSIYADPPTKCRQCDATIVPDYSRRAATEIEMRDIQIYALKSAVERSWDMEAFLFK